MKYRQVGKSGLKVSAVGLGGNNFGARLDEASSIKVIQHALDLGVNYIDTAAAYALGKSEEVIGKAIKGRRNKVHITTKVGAHSLMTPDRQSGSRENIMEWVDIELKRLDTDYIDLYLMHNPDPETPILESLRAMDDLVRAGKVRYVGCNGFSTWQVCDALWTSKAHNLESFIVAGANYNLLSREIEREYAPYVASQGLGIVCPTPLAGGFLTGKYRRGEEYAPPPRTARAGNYLFPVVGSMNPRDMSRRLTDANFDKLEKLEAFARERGHTILELALSWMLYHPWIGTVIPGAMNTEQVTQNVAAGDWQLTAQDMADLDSMLGFVRRVPGGRRAE